MMHVHTSCLTIIGTGDLQDLSEFGIAARRIKTAANVGEDNSNGHLLAWERNMQSSLESSLAVHLRKIIRPTKYEISDTFISISKCYVEKLNTSASLCRYIQVSLLTETQWVYNC